VYEAAPEPAFGPTHPGEIVADALDSLGVTVIEAARRIGVSRQTLLMFGQRKQRNETRPSRTVAKMVRL
jgi:hypothetical protein